MDILNKRISVIIPLYNDRAIVKTLEVIPKGVEIIVIDSSSKKDISDIVKEFSNVRHIVCKDRLYAGEARNLGASLASNDILVFIDSDTQPIGLFNFINRNKIEYKTIYTGIIKSTTAFENKKNKKPTEALHRLSFGDFDHGETRKIERIASYCLVMRKEDFIEFPKTPRYQDSLWSFMLKDYNFILTDEIILIHNDEYSLNQAIKKAFMLGKVSSFYRIKYNINSLSYLLFLFPIISLYKILKTNKKFISYYDNLLVFNWLVGFFKGIINNIYGRR